MSLKKPNVQSRLKKLSVHAKQGGWVERSVDERQVPSAIRALGVYWQVCF
jgi:hypothetical protein